jgi:hypothetical protein
MDKQTLVELMFAIGVSAAPAALATQLARRICFPARRRCQQRRSGRRGERGAGDGSK